MKPGMEVEVTELFAPQAGKRPANFIVLKYFLLGMLISNGIESIFIIPKTLSIMDENEVQLDKLEKIYREHDEFKAQLHEFRGLVNGEIKEQKDTFDTLIGDKRVEIGEHPAQTGGSNPIARRKGHHSGDVGLPMKKEEPFGEPNKLVEWMLLLYGIITLALGIFSVFKEHDKLLMVFIGAVAVGLVILFFSGLTLVVFMAILNDIIIAIISFKYLQLMQAPVEADPYAYPAMATAGPYGQVPQQVMTADGGQYVDPNMYSVNLGQQGTM